MLRIKDVKKSDKGFYQCLVKNDVGELSEEVDLAVSKLVIDNPEFSFCVSTCLWVLSLVW